MIKLFTSIHMLTYVGFILIAVGSILSLVGQNIKSDKDKQILTNEIKDLKHAEELKEARRKESIQRVAKRAQAIIIQTQVFLGPFLAAHNQSELLKIFDHDYPDADNSRYADPSILDPIKQVFLKTTMLEPSNMMIGNTPISELDCFIIQMQKVYTESNTILQHYGDLDHPLITVIDDLRNRSKMFIEFLPILKQVDGGVQSVFGNGVTDQWAEFFRQYFLIYLKCKQLCRENQ